MWGARCNTNPKACRRSSCLTPAICPHFQDDQAALADLLQALKKIPGVKHLRVASGVRHDLGSFRRRQGAPLHFPGRIYRGIHKQNDPRA